MPCEMRLEDLTWNAEGLVPVVAQDAETGEIRMLAYANADALRQTFETGLAYFYSRSRGSLWKKGESSGHTMAVREVWVDCDGDTVLYLVDPEGPSCHTGKDTCFYQRLEAHGGVEAGTTAAPTLLKLERRLRGRTRALAEKSYTKSLIDGGAGKIGDKMREEADEFAQAMAEETQERVAAEGSDVLYHMLVGLLFRQVPLRDLLTELSGRFGKSGLQEKASRNDG